MKSFVIDKDHKPIQKTVNFGRFLKDFRINRRVELDQYTENYYIRKVKLFDDTYSMYELLKSNILFIMLVARQMCTDYTSFEDLVSEGCRGLIKAIYKFEPEKGIKFLSYAVWYIRSYMMTCLNHYNELIHIPPAHLVALQKVNETIDLFYKKDGINCPRVDIEDEMELSFGYVEYLMTIPKRSMIISFDDTHESFINPDTLEETVLRVEDVFISEDSIADDELRMYSLRAELSRSLNTLTEREADILILFFGLGIPLKHQGIKLSPFMENTVEAIGEEFELVGGRICQIKSKAIKRLRHTSRSKLLRGYLG